MADSRRRVESSAIVGLAPVIALIPLWLLALAVIWLAVRLVVDIPFAWFALGHLALAVLLFVRPVQVVLLSRLIGARRPDPAERARLETAWRSVLQAARLPRRRYVLAVVQADELNAFACGGHLVVVTTRALETLPRDELAGVLAHELSHHLGSHTIAVTIGQWLSVPVLVLARIGFFLQSVARAATSSYASHSAALTFVGKLVSSVLTGISWVFLSGLLVANAIANLVGTGTEFQADARAVSLGFGRELSNALRRVIDAGGGERPVTLSERLAATHPPARTRVARIDAYRRANAAS